MSTPDWSPFMEATSEVFATMAGITASPQTPYTKSETNAYDISGNIGLTGQIHGAMTLCLGIPLACKITSSILGEDTSEMNEMVADTVGELSNVIAGKVKKILGDHGSASKITLPTVFVGPGQEMGYPPNLPCIVIPFLINEWETDFCLEVCVEQVS